MTLKKFIYFLVELDGKFRQIVNGIVVSLSTPKPLTYAPDGNQEISIGWERSPVEHGNIRNFSLPLGFVMEGATMLRHDFYTFNFDRRLFLVIKRLTYENNITTYKEYYKHLYRGELDFSTGQDAQGEFRFNIGIMEGGLQKLKKANEGTDYEIAMDTDSKNVIMDGMFLRGKFNWFVGEYASLSDGFPALVQLNNDNPIPGLAIFDVEQTADAGAVDATNLEYFATAVKDISDFNVTGLIQNLNNLGAPGPLSVRLIVWNTITETTRLTIDLTPADPYPENYNLVIDETFDLINGDRVFFKSGSHFSEGTLSVQAKSKPDETIIQGLTIYDLGKKLVEKMTGSADNFESPFLEAKNIILTSGDGVRGLPGAVIKTNWREYWKFVFVMTKAQMTITDKIRIDELNTAYDSTQTPTELGDIKDFKCTPALDKLATSIKIGHAEQQVDDLNGKFDFNGWMVFQTPTQVIADKQYDLQHNYKASPYEIEQTRQNYEGKTTTDKETDNNIFALAVLPDVYLNSFEALGSFFADGTPLAPGEPLLSIVQASPQIVAGMKLRITGTASNDQDVTVKAAQGWFFGQLIVTNEPLVNEASVNFDVEIIEGQYYNLDRTPPVTQLITPDDVEQEIKDSVFNVPLSPKRILLLHADWLAGMFHKYAPGKLTFGSANRNKELIADGIIEKADVPIVDLGDPIFLPYYFEFDVVSPVDMVEILEAQPNPVFSFIWNGQTYTGFFINGGIALNDREEQTFKLLACPENNMLNLL